LLLLTNLLNGVALVDPLTGLRLIRSSILKGWKVKSKGFDVEVELNHHGGAGRFLSSWRFPFNIERD